jgi:hypothetical protein
MGIDEARARLTTAEIPGIPEFVSEGALLGHLWIEGHFGVGDPLINQGAPTNLIAK